MWVRVLNGAYLGMFWRCLGCFCANWLNSDEIGDVLGHFFVRVGLMCSYLWGLVADFLRWDIDLCNNIRHIVCNHAARYKFGDCSPIFYAGV